MDPKALLKQAREAIKNKDYAASLKISKTILQNDKTNYMALVFLGLSVQEVGPKAQAVNAFKKAIQESPDNPLAWNGIISYYEKNGTPTEESKKELFDAYIKITKLESSDRKIIEYCQKIIDLGQGKNEELIDILYNVSKKAAATDELISSVLEMLIKIYEGAQDLPATCTEIYEQSLITLIGIPKAITSQIYSSYITILNKRKEYTEVLKKAEEMYEKFTTNTISLEWICKVFNQWYVEGNNMAEEYEEKAFKYCADLLKFDSRNSMGLFTKSIQLIKENKTIESVNLLTKVTTERPGLIHAWFLLSELYININLIEDANQALSRSEKLLKSMQQPNLALKDKLIVLTLKKIGQSNSPEDWKMSEEIYKAASESVKKQCELIYMKIQINLGHYSEVEKKLEGIQNELDRVLLSSYLLFKQEKFSEALEVLDKKVFESDEYYIQLGLVYWEVDYTKCLTPFIKAAKINPDSYLCYTLLGRYYQRTKQLDKSRRCFEKAFKLNSKIKETAVELLKIYIEQEDLDANINLLTTLTTSVINEKNSWAYLLLGLTHLEQQNYHKAIENLRFVIRIDKKNSHCWEALGDAYMASGAHKASAKCYHRALELSEDSVYSKLQLAKIKQILGEYNLSRMEFNEIVTDDADVYLVKSLSTTCLYQVRQCFRENRFISAKAHTEYCYNKLYPFAEKYNYSCLWKILSELAFLGTRLPSTHGYLNLLSKTYDNVEDLFELALTHCSKAIQIWKRDNPTLRYDFAVINFNYFEYLKRTNSKSTKKRTLLDAAFNSVKYCVRIQPGTWQNWNLLGLITMNQSPPNYALAQHSFIKATTVGYNCTTAWCNLGVLYFKLGDIKLANKAFSQGQRTDPTATNSWIGQALIAEVLEPPEAMDLFRHSTLLGSNSQSALGYGHWVCQTLVNSKRNAKIYEIDNMHAIPVAFDALYRYTATHRTDSCAWNMLGILCERLSLKEAAEVAFKNAYDHVDEKHKDKVRVNYARCLARNEKYYQAVEMYNSLKAANIRSGSGLAFTLFKAEQYEDSYTTYEQALHWLAEDEGLQSDMLVALGSIAYLHQGKEATKTLLLQSIQLKPPSMWGLYSTLSFGMLHDDYKLAYLVIKELDKYQDDTECLEHYANLLSYFYLVQGQHIKAAREVSKLIHRHPHMAKLWYSLANTLFYSENHTLSTKVCMTAVELGTNSIDISMPLRLISLNAMVEGDEEKSKLTARRALHYNPSAPENWACFLLTFKGTTEQENDLLEHIISLSPSSTLLKWTEDRLESNKS